MPYEFTFSPRSHLDQIYIITAPGALAAQELAAQKLAAIELIEHHYFQGKVRAPFSASGKLMIPTIACAFYLLHA